MYYYLPFIDKEKGDSDVSLLKLIWLSGRVSTSDSWSITQSNRGSLEGRRGPTETVAGSRENLKRPSDQNSFQFRKSRVRSGCGYMTHKAWA